MTISNSISRGLVGRNVSFAFSAYIIVIVVTLALSIIFVGYFSVKETIVKNNDDLISLEIRTLESFLDNYLSNHISVLNSYAQSSILVAASMHNLVDGQYPLMLKDELKEFQLIGKPASFALLDIEGVVIESDVDKINFSVVNLPIIDRILNEELDYYVEFFNDNGDGVVVRYIVPVLYNGLPEGVLICDVSIMDLVDVVFGSMMTKTYVSIISNGTFLVSTKTQDFSEYIEEIFHIENSDTDFLFRIDVTGHKNGLYALVAKVLALTLFIMVVFLVLFRFLGQKLFVEPSQIIRQAQKETDSLNTALLRVNEDLTQFAYIASHDLKSPLLAVTQLAGWIKEDCGEILPEGSKKHLKLMQERIARMKRLLDDLLEYSRVGRYDYTFEKVNIKELGVVIFDLVRLSDQFNYSFEGEANILDLPQIPVEIVLRNLFSNAIKHHDKECGAVKLICSSNKDYYILSVKDDGPGIEEALFTKAFEMFQTLKPRDEVEGSGMGLALIKKIVESYGGKVEMQSTLGVGTAITTYWPIPKAIVEEKNEYKKQ